MKTTSRPRIALILASSIAALLTGHSAQAANKYYDISNASGLTPGAATWDTGTTAAWATSNSPGTTAPGMWVAGDDARFEQGGTNTLTISGTVIANSVQQLFNSITTTISSGTLQLGNGTTGTIRNTGGNALTINSAVVLNSNATLDSTGAGAISIGGNITEMGGARSVTKTGSGTGTLTLSGTNSFSGGVILNAGSLSLGSTTALGATAGTFVINGGTLNSAASNLVLANNNAVTINSDFTFTGTNSLNLGTGAVSLGTTAGTTRTITASANTLTVGGVISDGTTATGLGKLGAGTLALTATNAYTGATTIGTAGSTTSGGVLTVSEASGSIATSSGYTIHGTGSRLNLDYSTVANGSVDRIADSASVALTLNHGGELFMAGNTTSGTSSSETVGTLTLGTGTGIISISNSGGGTSTIALTATAFSRGPNFATALVRGTNMGTTVANNSRLLLSSTSGITQIGTNTSAGGTDTGLANLTIVPYMIGATSASSVGTNFVTYDTTTGIRRLGDTEQSLVTAGATGDNVKAAAGANAVTGAKVFNSLLLNSGGTSATPGTATSSVTGNGNSLTLTSGALANVATSATGNATVSGFSSIIFGTTGANEAVITNTNGTTGGTLTINSAIDTSAAGGGLTKAGAGLVVLGASNLYTGATTINQGTLRAAANSALGSGTVTVTNGTLLQLQNNITLGNTINLYGTNALELTSGVVTLSGTVNLQTATTIALGSTAGASLEIGGPLNIGANTLTLNGSRPLTLSGTVSGTGILALANIGGTTIITADNSATYSGQVQVTRSTLAVGHNGALGTGNLLFGVNDQASTIRSADTTTRSISNTFSLTGTTGSTYIFGSSTAGLNGNLNFTNTGNIALGHVKTFHVFNRTEFSGGFTGTGGGLRMQTGTGTLVLAGTNTYTGTTTIGAGTLQFAKKASLYNGTTASWTAANITAASGATIALNVGGTNEFAVSDVNTLLTNISVANSSTTGLQAGSKIGFDTTNATGGTFTQGNAIADSTGTNGGAIGLTKLGTNTLVLDKTNTYTGATNVNGGSLLVSGSISGTVAVNSGGTLGGAGGSTGAITVNDGGTLSPGASTGILTTTGNLTFANNSAFKLEINTASVGTGYDRQVVGGDVTIASNVTLTLDNTFNGGATGDIFTFILNNGGNAVSGEFAGLANGSSFTAANGQVFTISYFDDASTGTFETSGGNDISLVAIPEPSSVATLISGLGGLVALQRFRRRRA